LAVQTLNAFFGVFCIGFGVAMVFYGLRITQWVYRLIIFTILFGILFGIVYNMFPRVELGVQIGAAVVCALLAGVGTYFLDWIQKQYGISLLVGMCAVYGGFFLSELTGQTGNIKLAILVVCFIIGFFIGGKLKLTLLVILTSSAGSGMLMYGISLEAGGFSATSWSLYAYLAFGAFMAILGACLQRYWFRDEYKAATKDADEDGVNDNDVFDDDEARICGCF